MREVYAALPGPWPPGTASRRERHAGGVSDADLSRARRLRRAVVLLGLLGLGLGLGLAWWMLRPASEPVTVDGAMARAGAAGVAERLADAAEAGTFRIVLTGEDLALLVRDALATSPVALRELAIDVHPAGAGTALLEAQGTVAGSGLPLRATARARHAGGRLDVELTESRLAGVALPGAARRAIDEQLAGAVDVGGLLGAEGVHIDDLDVEDEALVLTGRATDPDRVAERLRAAARARAGGREPPPERLGPGTLEDRQHPGDGALVALGDSIAAGTGSVDHRDAFPARLHRALGERDGSRGYVNLAEPGATARSMLTGGQVDRARRELSGRDVDVVVVSVGANELLTLLGGEPCAEDLESAQCTRAVDDAAEEYAAALDDVLGSVVPAAAGADVVLLTPYNPFSTGAGGPSEERTNAAVARLHEAGAEVAHRHGVAVADPASAFQRRAISLTRLRDRPPDIHPTPLGHDVLAWVVWQRLGS